LYIKVLICRNDLLNRPTSSIIHDSLARGAFRTFYFSENLREIKSAKRASGFAADVACVTSRSNLSVFHPLTHASSQYREPLSNPLSTRDVI